MTKENNQLQLDHELDVGANVEVPFQQVNQPAHAPRRTTRSHQYTARYDAFRKSLGKPLAKLALIGIASLLVGYMLH